MQPEKTEAIKINQFPAHLALQIFRKTNATSKRALEDVLIVFRERYVKLGSKAAAKHRWNELTFDLNTKSLSDFSEELGDYAEPAFSNNAQKKLTGCNIPECHQTWKNQLT